MSPEIQNICGTFISKNIHQPFGRFGSTATIIRGPSSVQLVQRTQKDFLGYRERDYIALSSWFHLWDMETGMGALPYAEFSLVESFQTTRFPTKSRDGGGHWDGIHHHPICCWARASHLAQPPPPSIVASKLTQAENTGFCQHAWRAMCYSDIKGSKIRELFCCWGLGFFHKRIEVNFLSSIWESE